MSEEEQKAEANVNAYNEKLQYLRILLSEIREAKSGEMIYTDYSLVDHINLTESEGYKYFMRTYTPGTSVVEIGAGLGGPGRMMLQEFGVTVDGLEYNEENVAMGNEISRELGMPELLRKGDAMRPYSEQGIPDGSVDAVILFGIVCAIPTAMHKAVLENAYRALKPNGLMFFEDFVNFRPIPEFPEQLRHIITTDFAYFSDAAIYHVCEKILTDIGFEILEISDETPAWNEGSWKRANDIFLTKLEEKEGNLSEFEENYLKRHGILGPRLCCDLSHLALEEITAKFPLTVKYSDPKQWAVCKDPNTDAIPEKSFGAMRAVCRKPAA